MKRSKRGQMRKFATMKGFFSDAQSFKDRKKSEGSGAADRGRTGMTVARRGILRKRK